MFTGRVTRTSTGAMDNILKMANEAKRKELAVGFPNGVTAKGSGDATNIEKAIFNEFGHRGSGKAFVASGRGGTFGGFGGPSPPRPFMRNAMRDNRNKYQSSMKSAAKQLMNGTANVDGVLKKLGIMAKGDIQKEIDALRNPANAPLTIAIKGSSNPLVNTGEMKGSVNYHVRGK